MDLGMQTKTSSVRAACSLSWPVPPFFRDAAAPAAERARTCRVELLDGNIVHGELLCADWTDASIDVETPDQCSLHFDLDQVRTLWLTQPLALTRDANVVTVTGADPADIAEATTFSIRFHDGQVLDGTTRGFVREKAGLFLYLLEGEASGVARCFIPAQQLADAQIGPLLGEMLFVNNQVSSSDLAAALEKQAQLRQEKLGKHLSDRGIVSHEDLKRALQAQHRRPSMKLGELLLEAGMVSHEQLDEALKRQAANGERRLGDILVEMGIVTTRLVQMALAEKLGIPFVNVREFQIEPAALKLVSATFANRHQVLPLLCVGDSLVVAMENPLAMDFAQELDFLTKHSIVPVIANPVDLRVWIAKLYGSLELAGAIAGTNAGSPDGARARDLARMNVGELASELDRIAPAPRQLVDSESDARITDNALVRLINQIIIEAHAQGASDIHIESNAGASNTRVRFRKDGELEDYMELQPAYRSALVSRIKVMAGLDISEHRRAQDGKIAFSKFGALQIELRVAVVPTSDNLEDVVLRILGGVEPLPLDKLGLGDRDMAELKRMVSRSYGLVLVCGPTGSGKTTTLHSILHTINRPDIKIWTAEDPVEITQAGLRQVQVNSRIDWTFAAAMRAFLRADPDVIMVGEMRDAETTKIGIEASLTGHLVFSTLHTNSAAESIVRLLELGMDPFNFADALIGILSQRLARKLCRKCRRPRAASDEEIANLAQEYCMDTALDPVAVSAAWRAQSAKPGKIVLYDAVGCDACSNGYKGRVGVYELLTATAQVKTLIRARGTAPQLAELAQAGGMRMLRQDAIDKVLSGLLDLDNARAVST